MLARACRMAKSTGWKDPEGTLLKKLVFDVILNAFDRKDHNGFHNSAEIGLQFGIGEPSELARNAEALAATEGADPFTSRELWELAARAHAQSRDDSERDRCPVSAAECNVALADADGDRGMAAASHPTDAISSLRRVPNTEERRRQLELRLRKAQATVPDQMGTISTPVDLTQLRKEACECVGGLSLPQAFAAFAHLAASPSPDKLRDEARKRVKKSLLSSIMPKTIVDGEGKVVSKAPAFDGSEETEGQSLRHEISQSEDFRRKLVAFGQVDPARQLIHIEHPIEQRDFFPLVAMTPFVPADRQELFSLAFARFFGGDFISALHILVPQLENSLRYVLKLAGHEPSSIKSDMTQGNRSLSVMLEKDRDSLEEIYGPAIVFEIDGLFNFRGGPALRHQAAHGLVSDEACHGPDTIYACWFIFRLCCLHVAERWDELAEWMDGNQGPEKAAKPPDPAKIAADAAEGLASSVDPADS